MERLNNLSNIAQLCQQGSQNSNSDKPIQRLRAKEELPGGSPVSTVQGSSLGLIPSHSEMVTLWVYCKGAEDKWCLEGCLLKTVLSQ